MPRVSPQSASNTEVFLSHDVIICVCDTYRQISNISLTESQTLNDSCLVLQLSLSNPLKPGIKSRMKM